MESEQKIKMSRFYLSSGEIGGGSALLREDGDEGADPAVAMNERGAGERREVNWVLISLTKEGMEVEEEEEGGEGEVGERANTGTAQRGTVRKRKYKFK